jgi:hypothetical protein
MGLASLLLVLPVGIFLGAGVRGAEPSLLVLGPLSRFTLPVVAMIAFWWKHWPGSSLRAGWSRLIDPLIVARCSHFFNSC